MADDTLSRKLSSKMTRKVSLRDMFGYFFLSSPVHHAVIVTDDGFCSLGHSQSPDSFQREKGENSISDTSLDGDKVSIPPSSPSFLFLHRLFIIVIVVGFGEVFWELEFGKTWVEQGLHF